MAPPTSTPATAIRTAELRSRMPSALESAARGPLEAMSPSLSRRARRSLIAAIAMSPLVAPAGPHQAHAAGAYSPGRLGYDISWPQCDGTRPSNSGGFSVVGVTGGRPFTGNPCLRAEFDWARGSGVTPSTYINVDFPLDTDHLARGATGPAGTCADGDMNCVAYNYGYNTVVDATGFASAQGVEPAVWWLDVETTNNWGDDLSLNARDIAGAIDALQARKLTVGAYSTPGQWGEIAGDYRPNIPAWTAGAGDLVYAPRYCADSQSFTAGPVWIAQFPAGNFDGDYSCGQALSYWIASADGGVFTLGSSPYLGSQGGASLAGSVTGIAATPSGRGYWEVAA